MCPVRWSAVDYAEKQMTEIKSENVPVIPCGKDAGLLEGVWRHGGWW